MSAALSTGSLEIKERRVALVTVITPLLGVIVSIVACWGKGVTTLDLALCGALYALTMVGITMGYHRLFTHRSFKCAAPITVLLGILGCMAAQGPILFWAACHRRHHQFSDQECDPHSPHGFGIGFRGAIRGWWHAHTGWMLSHKPENYRRLVPDLIRDRWVVGIDRLYLLWIALGLVLPALVGALVSGSWHGLFMGLMWGGFIRVFLVHHSTWSINSICHLFGSSPMSTNDRSRNNVVCAVLTFGEGWHNNHHAFPASARHGLRWWQLDLIYTLLRGLRICGLVSDIREPDAEQIARALKLSDALNH